MIGIVAAAAHHDFDLWSGGGGVGSSDIVPRKEDKSRTKVGTKEDISLSWA